MVLAVTGGGEAIAATAEEPVPAPPSASTSAAERFFGGNMQPATYEIDWVRTYPLR